MTCEVACTGVGENADVIMALMADAGFAAFEETADGFTAFVSEADFENLGLEQEVQALARQFGFTHTSRTIPGQNWNQVWEGNFSPVELGNWGIVRATFHPPRPDLEHDLVIEPRMAFGTGHHATTKLMMLRMKEMDFTGCKVLDFGCGTGILAILAEKLGAPDIEAIDTDEWAFENAQANATLNGCHRIGVQQGSIDTVPGGTRYHIILANINRNVLVECMAEMADRLVPGGTLLLSGILAGDAPQVIEAASGRGLHQIWSARDGKWCSIELKS